MRLFKSARGTAPSLPIQLMPMSIDFSFNILSSCSSEYNSDDYATPAAIHYKCLHIESRRGGGRR